MIKPGTKVSILDENAQGVVLKVNSDNITVEIDGFEYDYPHEKIVFSEDINLTGDTLIKDYKKETNHTSNHEKKEVSYDKKMKGQVMRLDLHFHEIHATDGYNNFDKMNIQLDYFKKQFEIAIEKRFKKVTAIHGKGEGILKKEVRNILQEYDKIIFHDAPYSQGGATEIILL